MALRFAFLVAVIGLASTISSPSGAADEPPHEVVFRDGAIEYRDYAPQIAASVEVDGSMARAGNAGFRPLAGYIFGGNTVRSGAGSAEIAMTTPVTQARSREIAMTTPVTQSNSGDGRWQVSFIMPSSWTMDTLPIPDDPRVALVEVPARRLAVIRFSGGPSDARFEAKAAELMAYLADAGQVVIGAPVYARYDPPWVPTPFRRNEVMIEIQSEQPVVR
ncbi:SOUL family heme-binding protein [Maricaulis maris]|uniref:SOUL family heme-binding protein n=1 Tax=Maricaulis maris TaxID=74318 RepID=UPI003A9013DD